MSRRHFTSIAIAPCAALASLIAGSWLAGSPAWAGEPEMRPLRGQADPPVRSEASFLGPDVRPINLESALRLAGVRNPELLTARERIAEAVARRRFAAAQFLPNLNFGGSYDDHNGNLQRTTGEILPEHRQAMYLGAGAMAVGGSTVAVPGVVWDAQLSEVIYNNLIAKQVVVERSYAQEGDENSVLLQTALAYEELLRAEQARAVALENREETREVARLTAAYAQTGQGKKADADRAATELSRREYDATQAEGDVLTASARLCQWLSLDPSVRLQTVDRTLVPLAMVSENIPLADLIATAMLQRPELHERRTVIEEALLALRQARLLPWTPTVLVGFSGGTFGGGSNLVATRFGDFGGRSDFDVVAFWTLRNLGVGNRALIDESASRLHIENYRLVRTLDRVRDEVAEAHARTQARKAQIAVSQRAVATAQDAFSRDFIRIRRGGPGPGRQRALPIELLDSLRLLGQGRSDYVNAVVDYNRAELELYVALGQPPTAAVAGAPGAEEVPAPLPPSK